jgi:hypothetical protein
MPAQEAVQPTIIEWIKPIGSYLIIPALAIFFKFFFDLTKMVILQSSGSSEKSAADAEKERRLQHCETGLAAVNSDVDGNRRRIEAHDQRFDKITERVDEVYKIAAKK